MRIIREGVRENEKRTTSTWKGQNQRKDNDFFIKTKNKKQMVEGKTYVYFVCCCEYKTKVVGVAIGFQDVDFCVGKGLDNDQLNELVVSGFRILRFGCLIVKDCCLILSQSPLLQLRVSLAEKKETTITFNSDV